MLWLACVALLAQAPSGDPGERSPDAWAIPGHRVHIVASESLNSDSLGALARPGVILWLQTRSNALLPTTVRALSRFEESWVQVRPPIVPAHAALLRNAHRAGLWAEGALHDLGALQRLGVRRVALEQAGPLDDAAFQRLQTAGVARLQWRAPSVDLASFGRFLQLPGHKTLVLPEAPAAASGCGQTATPRLGEITVKVTSIDTARALAACGWRVRLSVRPQIDEDTLASLFRAVPNAELELNVGADERQAMAARRLLERLERASGVPDRRR